MNAKDLPAMIGGAGDRHEDDRPHALTSMLRADAMYPIQGVIVGELLALADSLRPIVCYAGQPGTAGIEARSTVELSDTDIGQPVVLMFELGEPRRPIVLGLLRTEGHPPPLRESARLELDADGRRVTISARERLTLRCGEASITLTHCGKVLLQGSYLSSRSTGVHRIKGGSIQLN